MGDGGTGKSASGQNEPVMKGWLFKWTNYLKGYQRRWFVLQNGHLSYYRVENNGAVSTLSIRRRRKFKSGNQAEMAHTCRGSISLHGALIYTVDATTFVISNGGTQTFHIRAASEVERQSWVTALELAKAKAIRTMESEDDEETEVDGSGNPEEWSTVIRKLEAQINDLETCSELIQKHWKALCKPLNELESNNGDIEMCQGKTKEVGERATLFRISTNAMINACMEYMKTCQTHGHKWIRLLEHEREQRMRLQEMVETLAQQHSNLEQAANAHSHKPMNSSEAEDEDEHEFYDAINENPGSPGSTGDNCITFNIPTGNTHRRHSSGSSSEVDEAQETKHVVVVTEKARKITHPEQPTNNMLAKSSDSARKRRTRIPDKPNCPLNLWGIMKNCIGKDLSKIPMPVNFSEPLSMLQRLTEDYEYANILDVAAKCTDPCEQLAYVAAFTISSYSTTAIRAAKPFNPLLGETYEFDRTEDLGWKVINEQVSHHPPMVAQFCEGRGWNCWQEFTMTSKFRGKYLQASEIIPLGSAFCEFKESKNKFSWRKVTTTVHNIIVGKLWVDQHGDMEIIGRGNAEGIKCHLKFIPYSYFGRDSQRRVKGVVMDAQDNVKWAIDGTWDDQVEVSPVISDVGTPSNPVYKTGSPVLAWKRNPMDPEAENYCNLSVFACQLNEMEEGIAPTDSRLRPDQRLMEMGKWDEANEEKLRLEEKQRAVRRHKEAEAEKAAHEDFKTWLENESKMFHAQYIRNTGIKKDHGDKERIYFDCTRSGMARVITTDRKRSLKSQGISKINCGCTSQIMVSRNAGTDECTVKYFKHHYGHENEIQHLKMLESDRQNIASKLILGVPPAKILENVRDNINSQLKRSDLLSLQDVHNVKNSFKINIMEGCYHEVDCESVNIWVENCRRNEENPVIFYKKQNLLCPDSVLNTEDFCLILMNSTQRDLARKFGNNIICIDSTHGLNAYDFELTTLLVIDEFKQGFPIAFMFTNRKDTDIFKLFFQKIKDTVGVITAQIFMTDVTTVFYNAWRMVMGAVRSQLFCSWHLDRAWRNNLNKIADFWRRENGCTNL